MRERFHHEDGQVLGLALAFLTFVALVLAATLTAAATNLHATQTLTQQRDERYAAEAGILAATAQMQNNRALGTLPESAGGCGIPPESNFDVNSVHVVVDCEPRPGSGAGPGAGNRPPYSVLALTSSGDGSNEGVIPVGVADLKVFGQVGSRGSCYPSPGRADLPDCKKDDTITDPGEGGLNDGYEPLVASPLPVVSSTATCPSGVAIFSQGTYSAPPSAPGCNTWWFQPGRYYFDFTNDDHDVTPNDDHVWAINTTVVGGIQDPSASRPGQPPTLPGACRAPGDPFASAGVQFVFGGDSRMQVDPTGRVELCAPPSTSKQQIAVYGMTPDFLGFPQSTTVLRNPDPQTASSNPPTTGYDVPENGAVIGDGQEAQAAIPAGGAASISVGGFPPLPEGSIVKDAVVNVVHHEDPALQEDNPTTQPLTVEVKDGARILGSQSFVSSDACNRLDPPSCTTSLSLKTALQDDPAAVGRLNVTFTTAVPPGLAGPYSSSVDGIQLSLDVDLPASSYRPLLGCTQLTLGTPADPQQPCPLLRTRPGAQLYVQGTVYAPTGGFDVNGEPTDPVRFDRGIIARTVVFRPGSGGAPAGVVAGGGFDRFVDLEATAEGTLRLATSVSFDDAQAVVEDRLPRITYIRWDIK
jgi:hypothetical protein